MHIRIYDLNSMGHTHHHGQPASVDQYGNPTQAVAGVLHRIKQHIRYSPEVLPLAVWDGRAQWRYDLNPDYKSGRHKTPEQRAAREAYTVQVPYIKKGLSYLPVIQVSHPHAEADDLAWALSKQLARQGHLVTLETSDTDWFQMIMARVQWQSSRSPHTLIEFDGFSSNSKGFPHPLLVPQVKALAGDDADDIEGVPKIAEKRAISLLSKYKSLENLLAATDDFMAFSQEPTWAHPLMRDDIKSRVVRNLQLIDLSKGPVLEGGDCHIDVGFGRELDMYLLFEDLGLCEFTSDFYSWEQACRRDVSESGKAIVSRALTGLSSSWSI